MTTTSPGAVPVNTNRWGLNLRFVEDGVALDDVLFDGVEIERQTETRLFRNLDVAVLDDGLLD